MQQIDTLTSLRAFAAAALLYFHQQVIIVPLAGGSDARFALGVSFFFVLSGFILYLNYGRLEQRSASQFLRARFARVYPVHIATLLLFIALAAEPWAYFVPDWQPITAANALLLQSWVPLPVYNMSLNAVSWSISTELAFYLAFPLLCRLRRFGTVVAVAVITTIAFVLVLEHFNSGLVPAPSRWFYSPNDFVMMNPLVRLAEFIVGIGFAKLYMSGIGARMIRFAPTILEALCIAAVLTFAAYSTSAYPLLKSYGHPLLGVYVMTSGGMWCFAALLFVVAHQAGFVSRLLQHPVMVLLGRTSFSLYMVHQIVITFVYQHKVLADQHWIVRSATIVLAAYALSYLIWRFIEEPSRIALRRVGSVTSLPKLPDQSTAASAGL